MRKSVYFIGVITFLTSYLLYEVMVYQALIPILQWSNNTLYLDVMASHQGWKTCKRFRGWCNKNHPAPQWGIIWKGEATFTV